MNGILQKYIQNLDLNPALEKFLQMGFPTKKLEAWKYTNIADALGPGFHPNPPKEQNADIKPKDSRIVLINGHFSKELSIIPQGIEIGERQELKNTLETDDSFELLNLGVTPLEIEIKIPKNFQNIAPIEIFHTVSSEGYMFCPRIRIDAGVNSKSHILETFNGGKLNSYFTNSLTEIFLEEGSSVEYVKSVNESLAAIHVGKVKAFCRKNSTFKDFTLSLGGKLTRNNIEVALLEEGSGVSANGVFALSKDQICDNYSLINHLVPHTNSEQLFKGLLDDESHGIFTGKIKVNPDAQKVNSNQLSKNLLLSKKAHVNSRPILEINADDVKCSHGAAIGKLNPEEIFYLETRGIPEIKAKRMLCYAFALEGIDLIESLTIKNLITEQLFDKLTKFDVGHFNENF